MFPIPKAVRVFVALLTINVVALPGRGEIIPANRRMIWQGNVGVPGGIPTRTKIFVPIPKHPR